VAVGASSSAILPAPVSRGTRQSEVSSVAGEAARQSLALPIVPRGLSAGRARLSRAVSNQTTALEQFHSDRSPSLVGRDSVEPSATVTKTIVARSRKINTPLAGWRRCRSGRRLDRVSPYQRQRSLGVEEAARQSLALPTPARLASSFRRGYRAFATSLRRSRPSPLRL